MIQYKMNPEIKQRWVAALRSGNYKQGKGYLNVNEFHCAYGVLCDLAVQDGVASWQSDRVTPEAFRLVSKGIERSIDSLTESVYNYAGFTLLTSITIKGKRHGISDLNDRGYTFTQLADLIEEQL